MTPSLGITWLLGGNSCCGNFTVTKLGKHSWDPSISGLPTMVELLLSERVLGGRSGPQAS